jgi:hypothetical protein
MTIHETDIVIRYQVGSTHVALGDDDMTIKREEKNV